MKILISHPTGNANLRAVLRGLDANENIKEFHTCIAANPNSKWLKLLPNSINKELFRRSFPIERSKIVSHPLKEFARLGFPKLGIKSLNKHETGLFSVDSIYRSLDKSVAKRIEQLGSDNLNAVYAYEDGALNSFQAAHLENIKSFYDLPIGYWKASRAMLEAERDLNPDWAVTLTGFKDSTEKLERKDQELSLADEIFVASSFTKNTLEYYSSHLNPVHVIPYGFPKANDPKEYDFKKRKKLKLLFVGGLSQRKGLSYMLEAVEGFKDHVELTLIGRKPVHNCEPLNKALAQHNWIQSLPHDQVLAKMREHDLLLFPSLFEGFGLVVTEAMSQGVPVVTTERTCGPDIIDHGKDGWIVKSSDSSGIADILDQVLQDPDLIQEIGSNALRKASLRPWSVYGSDLNAKLEDLISSS